MIEQEAFELPPQISLKSPNNKYLSVESNGHIKAASEHILSWELLNVIQTKYEYGIKTCFMNLGEENKERFIGIDVAHMWHDEYGSYDKVHIVAVEKSKAEQWEVEFLGNDEIALKSTMGHPEMYLGEEPIFHKLMLVSKDIGHDETWTFEPNPVLQNNLTSSESKPLRRVYSKIKKSIK